MTHFSYCKAVPAALAIFSLALTGSPASAASLAVELACASDYYSYCSQYDPDSPAVKKCMRTHGEKLSSYCIKALINAGEVTQAEVNERTAAAAARK